jgi:hypothetical protein
MPSLRGAAAPSWCTSKRDREFFALLTSKASQLEKAQFFCINGEPSGVGGKDKALWSVLGLRNQFNLDYYWGMASYSAGEFVPLPAADLPPPHKRRWGQHMKAKTIPGLVKCDDQFGSGKKWWGWGDDPSEHNVTSWCTGAKELAKMAKAAAMVAEAEAVADDEQKTHGMATRGAPREDTTAAADTVLAVAEEAVSARGNSSSSSGGSSGSGGGAGGVSTSRSGAVFSSESPEVWGGRLFGGMEGLVSQLKSRFRTPHALASSLHSGVTQMLSNVSSKVRDAYHRLGSCLAPSSIQTHRAVCEAEIIAYEKLLVKKHKERGEKRGEHGAAAWVTEAGLLGLPPMAECIADAFAAAPVTMGDIVDSYLLPTPRLEIQRVKLLIDASRSGRWHSEGPILSSSQLKDKIDAIMYDHHVGAVMEIDRRLGKRIKGSLKVSRIIIPSLVCDAFLLRAYNTSNMGVDTFSPRNISLNSSLLRGLEADIAEAYEKGWPSLVQRHLERFKSCGIQIDNYTPAAKNTKERLTVGGKNQGSASGKDGKGTRATTKMSDALITPLTSEMKIGGVDFDIQCRDKDRPNAMPDFDVEAVSQYFTSNKNAFTMGALGTMAPPPMAARMARVNAGDSDLAPAGHLQCAIDEQRKKWEEKKDPRVKDAFIVPNFEASSASRFDYQHKAVLPILGRFTDSLTRSETDVLSTVDTEYQLHCGVIVRAIAKNLLFNPNIEYHMWRTAQTPAIFHQQKGLMESTYADANMAYHHWSPMAIDGYKHASDKHRRFQAAANFYYKDQSQRAESAAEDSDVLQDVVQATVPMVDVVVTVRGENAMVKETGSRASPASVVGALVDAEEDALAAIELEVQREEDSEIQMQEEVMEELGGETKSGRKRKPTEKNLANALAAKKKAREAELKRGLAMVREEEGGEGGKKTKRA